MHPETSAYGRAQYAIALLKESIYEVLVSGPSSGMSNARIGRALGIYTGHVRHEGHIPRTLLAIMENEGIVQQDAETKRWSVATNDREITPEDHTSK